MKYLYVISDPKKLEPELVELIDETGEEDVWTIYMPDKTTPEHERERVHDMLDRVGILIAQRLEVPISAVVQKTWRIMKHYTDHEIVPDKGSECRQIAQRELALLNDERLHALKRSIRQMVAEDQAKRLGLELFQS